MSLFLRLMHALQGECQNIGKKYIQNLIPDTLDRPKLVGVITHHTTHQIFYSGLYLSTVQKSI
jgi:hypothetical protein